MRDTAETNGSIIERNGLSNASQRRDTFRSSSSKKRTNDPSGSSGMICCSRRQEEASFRSYFTLCDLADPPWIASMKTFFRERAEPGPGATLYSSGHANEPRTNAKTNDGYSEVGSRACSLIYTRRISFSFLAKFTRLLAFCCLLPESDQGFGLPFRTWGLRSSRKVDERKVNMFLWLFHFGFFSSNKENGEIKFLNMYRRKRDFKWFWSN